jgi:glycosyltransferase involved in cell wall biosynthesis
MIASSVSVMIAIPVLHLGGTEIQSLSHARSLIAGGYNVTVCCYFDEYDGAMVSMLEQAGAEVLLLGLRRNDGMRNLYNALFDLFTTRMPDVVHVQYIAPGLTAVVAARIARVPTIFATVHQPGRTYGWKEKMLLQIASRLTECVFCVSLSVEHSWFGTSQLFERDLAGSSRHFTIYNSVDTLRIGRLSQETDREEYQQSLGAATGPVIGCVARLRQEKGQAILLDAMVEIIRNIPETTVFFIGDGPDRAALEQQAVALGISDHVVWFGQLAPDEVFRLFGIMDLVVAPSLFEGFGLSAVEAMAAGLPVVGSRIDGLTEVIVDGATGILTPPGDAQAVAGAVIDLLLDRPKAAALGHAAKIRAEYLFSLEDFAAQTRCAYATYRNHF